MRILCFLMLAALAASALPQKVGIPTDPDPKGGFFTLTYGQVRQPDGTYVSMVGKKIPFTVEPAVKPRGYVPSSFTFDDPGDAIQFVYQNDRPPSYFGSGFETPSALDDIQTLGTAVGAPWQQLILGWRLPNRNIPFYVFGSYNNYLGDQGPGNSAFSGIIGDTFGGPFWQVQLTSLFPNVPGEYMITFDVSGVPGLVQTDNTIYFLQQFRQGDQNGPFLLDWAPFFSGGGGPNIGSSADMFWYDSDPMDGIYAYEEADLFNDPKNQITGFEANFAMGIKIDTNTSSSEVPPAEMLVRAGLLESGNNLSTWSSNNIFAVINNQKRATDDLYPVVADFTTFAPVPTILSLQVTVESSADVPGVTQDICMFNYTLNTWMVVNTTALTTTDQTITYLVGMQPNQFVRQSDGEMKLRVRAKNPTAVSSWRDKIDMVKWRVTHN